MWKICHGESWHFVNLPAEFGKICGGKLWSLIIINHTQHRDQLTKQTVGSRSRAQLTQNSSSTALKDTLAYKRTEKLAAQRQLHSL